MSPRGGGAPRRVVLIGPPGAGKGTQASRLSARLGVPAVSTGDVFRAHLRERTALGSRVRQFVDAGQYVPDDITNAMVADRLRQSDVISGFLLDGYPRTVAQAEVLDTLLAEAVTPVDVAVEICVDHHEVETRLARRAVTEQRADDVAATVRARLATYAEQSAPVIAHYEAQRLLVAVDGRGTVDEVEHRLAVALGLQ